MRDTFKGSSLCAGRVSDKRTTVVSSAFFSPSPSKLRLLAGALMFVDLLSAYCSVITVSWFYNLTVFGSCKERYRAFFSCT